MEIASPIFDVRPVYTKFRTRPRDRPLPLIRAIARSLNLSVNTQGVESDPEVFKPAERQDLKPTPKVKGAAPIPTDEPVPSPSAKATAAIDLSLQPSHAWYLVHTKARQEDTAITNLQRQNFRCYMPMLYVEKVRRGKPVVVSEPMFPSYVFVQLDATGNGQSCGPGDMFEIQTPGALRLGQSEPER